MRTQLQTQFRQGFKMVMILILHRWKLTVAFVVVLWLATSAGLCTATSDAPKSLCRPRLHQAAGNVEEMRHIDLNTTRLLHARVTLRSLSFLSLCLIFRLPLSVSHSLSFILYLSSSLSSARLIRCVSFRVFLCVSFAISHSLCLVLCVSFSFSFSLTDSLSLIVCVSSSVSHPLPVYLVLCLILCVSSSVSHSLRLIRILCVSSSVTHSLLILILF